MRYEVFTPCNICYLFNYIQIHAIQTKEGGWGGGNCEKGGILEWEGGDGVEVTEIV